MGAARNGQIKTCVGSGSWKALQLCMFVRVLRFRTKALSDNSRSPGSGPNRVKGAREHLLRASVQGIMPATKFLKELNKKTFQTSD